MVGSVFQFYGHLGHLLLALAMCGILGFQLFGRLQSSSITNPRLFLGSGKFRPQGFHGGSSICSHNILKILALCCSYYVAFTG